MFKREHKLYFYAAVLVVLGMLIVACSPGATVPGAAQVDASGGGITVVGEGEAFGTPDRARLEIGVETFAENVAEATSQNEASVQAIMAALEAQGIAQNDIQTSNYSVWAEQEYSERGPTGVTGYRVSNMVSVTIRDITKVGDVIAAATEAGANTIHGISFSVADPAALEAEAREAAITDARQKAESLADLSGVELGEVVSVSEVIGQPGIPYAFGGGRAVAEDAAPSISPGELGYSVQVQVTFAIR